MGRSCDILGLIRNKPAITMRRFDGRDKLQWESLQHDSNRYNMIRIVKHQTSFGTSRPAEGSLAGSVTIPVEKRRKPAWETVLVLPSVEQRRKPAWETVLVLPSDGGQYTKATT